MFDFVATWKVLSIALTAFFGALGLLKDFKDKQTGKVTLYGKLSLAGLVISALLGISAQLKEQSDQETSKIETAKQTLDIVKNTQASVFEIKRLIYRIGRPKLYLTFVYECNQKTKQFCDVIKNKNTSIKIGKSILNSELNPVNDLSLRIDFFRHKKDYDETIEGNKLSSDMVYTMYNLPTDKRDKNGIVISVVDFISSDENSNLEMSITTKEVNLLDSNGKIVGIDDLRGSYFMITGLHSSLKIKTFMMETESNIRTDMNIKACEFKNMPTFNADNTPTIFNHLGDYINGCQFSEEQNIDVQRKP